MRPPSPRRMPGLGSVRLSVKLGLCFGAILALTAAIVAVNLVNINTLQSAHERVTTGALALRGALGLALALARHLTRRLVALSRAAEALAEGDVDYELSVKGSDEVARTAGALASMVDHLRALAGAADRVAAGDLT